jgi:hypothetical protein
MEEKTEEEKNTQRPIRRHQARLIGLDVERVGSTLTRIGSLADVGTNLAGRVTIDSRTGP